MSEMDKELFAFQIADDSESEHIAAPQYSYWRSVFRKFFSSKVAIFMMILAGIVILLSIFQPMFSGYDPHVTPNINKPEMKYIRPCDWGLRLKHRLILDDERRHGINHNGEHGIDGKGNALLLKSVQHQRHVQYHEEERQIKKRRRKLRQKKGSSCDTAVVKMHG